MLVGVSLEMGGASSLDINIRALILPGWFNYISQWRLERSGWCLKVRLVQGVKWVVYGEEKGMDMH